jgi:pimeloyl-ACP methyl ester carboxylesterase
MSQVELSAGIIEYEDTGGGDPVVVLLHGLAMDGSVWRHVVGDLREGHRCIVPTLPLGSHRRPMRPDTDLSMSGHARIVAEFLDRLKLDDVTLVGNDWGVAQLVAVGNAAERVGRLVLTSQEAFDNYPPGLPGRMLALAAKLPGGLNAFLQPMRLRSFRNSSLAYGSIAKRPIPQEVTDAWVRPVLTQREIRRDLVKYLRSAGKGQMIEAAERLRSFDRPALVVWGAEDRLMPLDHGRRLAALLPQGQLAEIPDSYTLIPEDQPAELARAIRQFVRDTALAPAPD